MQAAAVHTILQAPILPDSIHGNKSSDCEVCVWCWPANRSFCITSCNCHVPNYQNSLPPWGTHGVSLSPDRRCCLYMQQQGCWLDPFFGVFNNACDNIVILLAVLRWVKPTLSVETIPTLHGSWSRWKLHGVNVQREQQFPNLHACHHVIQY